MPWMIRRVERRVSPERRRALNNRATDPESWVDRRRAERRAGANLPPGAPSTSSPESADSAAVRRVRLTKREQEIKELIAAGLGNKEIARRLNIATNTVKSHVHNMLGKLAALTPPDRRSGNRNRRGTSRRSYRFGR